VTKTKQGRSWADVLDDQRQPSPSERIQQQLEDIRDLARDLSLTLGIPIDDLSQTIAGQPGNLAAELERRAVEVCSTLKEAYERENDGKDMSAFTTFLKGPAQGSEEAQR
jgi:hypothetical protein